MRFQCFMIFVVLFFAGTVFSQNIDFNADSVYTCDDVELLQDAMRSANANLATYDLDGSGEIDWRDIESFLDRASELTGKELRLGDFNTDGMVDHRDVLIVAAHWLRTARPGSPTLGYCDGDVDGDQVVSVWDENFTGLNWQFGTPRDHRFPADVELVRERDGDGIVFGRTSQFDLIAYPESVGEAFEDRLVATRVDVRMHNEQHGLLTVDGLRVEGALHQVGFPGLFGMTTSPKIDSFHSVIEAWVSLDSHLLIKNAEVALGAGAAFTMAESNDRTDPLQIADTIAIDGVAPYLGLGELSSANSEDIFALYARNAPSDWNELSLLRLVTPLDENGNPGEVFLTVGLQGADDDRNPLPDLGLIEFLSVPFITQPSPQCDLDLDGVCDGNDFDLLSPTATREDIDAWLSEAGIVRGDADFDGDVDAVDLNQLGINWLTHGDYDWRGGDFDRNGVVDASDLNQVGVNWQYGVEPSPAAVPEPRSISMLLLCALSIWGLCRNRMIVTVRQRCTQDNS